MHRTFTFSAAAWLVLSAASAFAGGPGQGAVDNPNQFFDGRGGNPAMEAYQASGGAAPLLKGDLADGASEPKPHPIVAAATPAPAQDATPDGIKYGVPIGAAGGAVAGALIGGVSAGAGASVGATLGWAAAGALMGTAAGVFVGLILGTVLAALIGSKNP